MFGIVEMEASELYDRLQMALWKLDAATPPVDPSAEGLPLPTVEEILPETQPREI